MNRVRMALLAGMSLVCFNVNASENQVAAQTMSMDCANMGPDVQQFASQLSAQNKAMFCGQFTESQRAAAMQMVGQPDETGNPMTADQTVQKVASTTTMQPSQQQQKTPTGCPVK